MTTSDKPDFAGAFAQMIDKGSPSGIVRDGWFFWFPHSESRLVAVRHVSERTDEYDYDRFKQAYRERYGKRFRG